ncbi:prepilin-type N-terminal cleavage/methylation domain-containing protein [Motilimonas sp. 1_MG-2023]|nr:prepilin-type N-terminal cleavage/methylation domain-containing protein [Motilimonas sp. 1_MG-2023]MCE0558535.1 type II secretion system GspH family protein [Motilimonas sp. E26]
MPSSTIKLQSKQSCKRGFTLIELLVVMALLGLIASIAVPRLWNQLEQMQQRQAIEKVWLNSFKAVKKELKDGHAIAVNEAFMTAQLKEVNQTNWQVSVPTDIVYRPHHVTTGGNIIFKIDQKTHWQLSISRLDGQIELSKL